MARKKPEVGAGKPRNRRPASPREPKQATATPGLPRPGLEELEEVVRSPLDPELPINDDAPLAALDTDAVEILNDTQAVADPEPDPIVGGAELVDKKRAVVLSGGDVDVAWDQPDIGEEAVGGSTPTPDQDVVDDLGQAAGVTYQDDEPLRPDEKISARDDKRWEVDPASAEDYEERQQALFSRRRKKRPGAGPG